MFQIDKRNILKILPIPESTFRVWANRFVKVSPGQGKSRKYDGADLVLFALALVLTRRGFRIKKLKVLFDALKTIRKSLDPFDREIRVPESIRLIIFGDCEGIGIEYSQKEELVMLIEPPREYKGALAYESAVTTEIDMKWLKDAMRTKVMELT